MKPAFRKALLLALPLAALTACVKNSPEIGKDLIDKTLLFDTYTVEFPIEEIQLRRANDLSGFSDTRLAIGAIRDETFGLTTRSTAFGLVPALDTLDPPPPPDRSASSRTSTSIPSSTPSVPRSPEPTRTSPTAPRSSPAAFRCMTERTT